MRVVICGTAAIGTASAFYRNRRRAEVIVFERSGVACAASGKTGGFLATGEAMTELIFDDAAHSTDLTPFDPGRLRTLDPARLQ